MYTELKEPLSGYWISKDGIVITRKGVNQFDKTQEPRELKRRLNKYGYYDVAMRYVNKDGIRKKRPFEIHRIMAETFIPNPENLPQVNHIDGNKLNNTVENLEWCTARYNTKHSVVTGHLVSQKGENNVTAKLKDSDIPKIMEMFNSKVKVKDIAIKYGVKKSTINNVVYGYQWNHITKLPRRKKTKPLGQQNE